MCFWRPQSTSFSRNVSRYKIIIIIVVVLNSFYFIITIPMLYCLKLIKTLFIVALPLGILRIYSTFVLHVKLVIIENWLLFCLKHCTKVFIAFVKSFVFFFFQDFSKFLGSFHICKENTNTDVSSETLLFTMIMEKH